jgi:hypothetical protein
MTGKTRQLGKVISIFSGTERRGLTGWTNSLLFHHIILSASDQGGKARVAVKPLQVLIAFNSHRHIRTQPVGQRVDLSPQSISLDKGEVKMENECPKLRFTAIRQAATSASLSGLIVSRVFSTQSDAMHRSSQPAESRNAGLHDFFVTRQTVRHTMVL